MKKVNKTLAHKIAVALTGTMLVAGTAFAAEPEFQLDQITVTATRTAQTVASTPGDVTVITAEQIEQKGAKNLADALEGVPGVTIARFGSTGQKTIPYILGSDRVLVLVDGKRINTPQGVAVGASTVDLSTIISANNIEKIEIVRGGGSVLYGADAVGGVINVITKKGSGAPATIVDIGFGPNDTRRATFTNQGKDNGFGWYITGTKDKSDGQRQNDYFDGDSISARFDKNLSSREDLSLTFDYVGSEAGLPGKMQQVNGKYVWGTSSALADYSDTLKQDWGMTYTRKKTSGDSTIKLYQNNQVYSGELLNTYTDQMVPFRHKNEVKAFEYQDNVNIEPGHLLTWGTDLRWEKVNSDSGTGKYDNKRTVKALYLQDTQDLTDRLSATTGLRYEDNSQYGDKLLPKVAFNYKEDTNTSYFASWGRVFNAPKFDDLYWPFDGWMQGNPNLKPETGWTAEAGMKKRINNDSEATLSFFKRDLNDAIRWNDDWTTTENLDNLEATGINFSYVTKLSDATNANISYTYTDSRKNNERDYTTPYHAFSAGLNIKQGKLSETFTSYYTSSKGVAANRLPSHFTMDAAFNYQISDQQTIYLTINNVFDKEYQNVSGYPAQERTIFLGFKQTL